MKKNIIIILALLAFFACGSKNGQTKHADAADSAEEDARDEIVALIHDLYAAAAQNEGGIDRRFACSEWQETVAAVEEKDAQLEEVGFFNEDYWTDMQDSNPDDLEAREIKFVELDPEEGTAMVSFILDSSVQTVHVMFACCCDEGEWRVHNIIKYYVNADGNEESVSLLEAMHEYLDEP